MKQNFQKVLEHTIEQNQKNSYIPTLLLHSCCAPCSSYCLEYLSQYFYITVFYYNPNIYPREEYQKRAEEQRHFIECLPAKYAISFVEGSFDEQKFYETVRGHEQDREGGERCFLCYELRLREAAALAVQMGMDYFTTTLSISPLKNGQKLNEIGDQLAGEYGVRYLNSDFKKKNGYQRSVELSKEYGMYRQYYCGCVFSKRQRDEEIAAGRQETKSVQMPDEAKSVQMAGEAKSVQMPDKTKSVQMAGEAKSVQMAGEAKSVQMSGEAKSVPQSGGSWQPRTGLV